MGQEWWATQQGAELMRELRTEASSLEARSDNDNHFPSEMRMNRTQ